MFRFTRDPSLWSFIQCLAKITVIDLAKHCIKLPDDGSLVIRNMPEHFKYFVIILIVSTNYIFVHLLDDKVFETKVIEKMRTHILCSVTFF